MNSRDRREIRKLITVLELADQQRREAGENYDSVMHQAAETVVDALKVMIGDPL